MNTANLEQIRSQVYGLAEKFCRKNRHFKVLESTQKGLTSFQPVTVDVSNERKKFVKIVSRVKQLTKTTKSTCEISVGVRAL